jgi:hypothetical protein
VTKFFKKQKTIIKFWKWMPFIALLFPIFFFIRAASYEQNSFFFTLFDDSMISMTYARTLSDTGELVWYPGADRVQGFTNLLWTLFMAFLHYLGLAGTQVSASIQLTGILCLLGTSFLSARLVTLAIPKTQNQCLWVGSTAAIIPLLYPLIYWSLRGMEVGFLCFLALSTMTLCLAYENHEIQIKRKIIFAATLFTSAIGVFTRLDFAVLVVVIVLVQFFLSKKKHNILIFTITHLGFVIFSVLAVIIFQFFYYGDFFPNTYRLKIEGYSAIDRILNGLANTRNIAALIFLVIASVCSVLKNKHYVSSKIIITCSCVFLSASVYSIWVGGDAWEWSRMANRYVSVTLPFAIISIMLGAHQFFYKLRTISKKTKVKIFFVSLFIIYLTIFYPRPSAKGLLLGFILVTFYIFFSYKIYKEKKKNCEYHFHAAIVGLILTLVSGWGTISWIVKDGMHVKDDLEMSKKGIYLKKVTKKNAIIATVWAGAPAYYSQRSMIDLLGKSDRHVANIKPIGKINPGHNKWDYDYSIGKLRPDIVFQLFFPTDIDKQKLKEWGYVQKCFSDEHMGYFLKQSKFINFSLLSDC